MIFAEIQEADGEKLLVIRLVAPKGPDQKAPGEVPKFNLYIDESWNTRDYITPALTDITNRTFTEDQITLMSPCDNTPDHLTVEKIKKIEAAHAATSPSETLVMITAEPDERDDYLTVLNPQTGQGFKVNNAIELTDALCDFVKPLKMKTYANATVEVASKCQLNLDLVNAEITISDKGGGTIIISIPEGKEEHEWRIKPTCADIESVLKVTYSYDDLIIGRKISCWLNLPF